MHIVSLYYDNAFSVNQNQDNTLVKVKNHAKVKIFILLLP